MLSYIPSQKLPSPKNPSGHGPHVWLREGGSSSIHETPMKHGLSAQASKFISQKTPDQPSGHSHDTVYWDGRKENRLWTWDTDPACSFYIKSKLHTNLYNRSCTVQVMIPEFSAMALLWLDWTKSIHLTKIPFKNNL